MMGTSAGHAKWQGLDGLRGTAILAVVVCHYSAWLPTTSEAAGALVIGWAGVDLFFVISGFLITGILLDARGTPHYFRNFYARRALRIFPLYFAFLAVVLLLLLTTQSSPQLWRAQPWLWTYTANYWLPTQSTWDRWSEMMVPLWSLAVEEQFYLAWPLVVFAVSPRTLLRICIGVIIAALALRLILTAAGVDWFALYMWTPTRADPLAAGALVALLLRQPDGERRTRRLAGYAGPIALLLILLTARGFDPTRHPWLRVMLYSALAAFFAALLVWSIDSAALRGIPRRFYELPVLRAIGGYSYGIYLLHLPLAYATAHALHHFNYLDPAHPTWSSALLLITLSSTLVTLIAVASFHLYEKPFLNLKHRFPAGKGQRRERGV
ncbi:MAG: acyltransferase family protein [Armatimonadota bacterium]